MGTVGAVGGGLVVGGRASARGGGRVPGPGHFQGTVGGI